MSEITPASAAAITTVSGFGTVVVPLAPQAPAPKSKPEQKQTPQQPVVAPFPGHVHKVSPTRLDPSGLVRVWRELPAQLASQSLVALDISDIAELDRRSVTAMVQSFQKLDGAGVEFCLCAPQRHVEAMLELLGVLHLVELYPTVEQAKASFRSSP
jgi:anti-anti-sigma regulatory factor